MYAYFYTNFTLDYPTYCSSETKNATLLSTFSDDGRAQIQSACSKSEMLCDMLSVPFVLRLLDVLKVWVWSALKYSQAAPHLQSLFVMCLEAHGVSLLS